MSRSRLLNVLVHICRFGLAAFFLVTAAAKLYTVGEFATKVAELLSNSGMNYERWKWPVTVGVIIAELVIAAFLLSPRAVRIGAVLAGLLLIGFSAFALYYVYVLHGEALDCGCLGRIMASQLGVKTALRNLVLLIPVIVVLVGYRRRRKVALGVSC